MGFSGYPGDHPEREIGIVFINILKKITAICANGNLDLTELNIVDCLRFFVVDYDA